MIEAEADDQADIIWGSVIQDDMDDKINITVIATGFDSASSVKLTEPTTVNTIAAAAPAKPNRVIAAPADLDGDLDVPAYIRMKAD